MYGIDLSLQQRLDFRLSPLRCHGRDNVACLIYTSNRPICVCLRAFLAQRFQFLLAVSRDKLSPLENEAMSLALSGSHLFLEEGVD